MKVLPVILLLLATALPATADPLRDAKRIVFLGDSITHAGQYVIFLSAALRETHPDAEFINLGLPSEGCTGLSEPAHPFPRPNVHERLDRVLMKADPDVVIACYGMNDGIYYPFSEERFAKYKEGITTLAAKAKKHGAKVILVTPPPFDPLPLGKKGKLLPSDAEKFSWTAIYEHYDRDVIARYALWIMEQEDTEEVDLVIDVHAPVTRYVSEQRKAKPNFVLSGDGVHLNRAGHRVIAEAIHEALYKKPLPEIDAPRLRTVSKQQAILRDAWISHVGHKRPGVKRGLPLDKAKMKAAALEK